MSHAQFVHEFLLGSTEDPHAPAVHDLQGRCVRTFSELEAEARGIAADLGRLSVVGGDRVMLKLRATPEAIAALLACSMRNAVFVPVDPDAPEHRIRTLVDLAEPAVVIEAADDDHGLLPGSQSTDIDHGRLRATRAAASGFPLAPLETSDAYIVFTSGTTGRPKGICMSHRAILAFWRGLIDRCPVPSTGRVGSVSPLHFDLSLLDLGLALGCGASLVQLDRRLLTPPRLFLSAMIESGITQLNCVPSVWRILLRHVPGRLADVTRLRSTLFGGELFPIEEVRQLSVLRPDLELINCFGQSESLACSFLSLPRPLPDVPSPPIGPPILGADMILVDQAGREVTEVGEVGEIHLRGSLLFSGYWRDPEATAQVLRPNPLRPMSPERVFRTGDLARRGPHQTLFYVGRRDLQVQVRGNRVELEEIERCLDGHEAVAETGVYADEPDGNVRLVALVVARQAEVDAEELRRFCARLLPSYMIPAEVRFVGSLPRTPAGKLDRTRLEQHSSPGAPRTPAREAPHEH